MSYKIPVIEGSDNGAIITAVETVDDGGFVTGRTVLNRPIIDTALILDAYDERTRFDLWTRKRFAREHVHGQWRGQPNKYSVR